MTGRFHFAYGFTYTLAAYMAFTFTFRVDIPFWPGAVLGVLVAALVGASIERFVYRPLAANAGPNALLAVFVAALGLGIVGDNLVRLFWGSETQAYFGPTKKAYHVWDTVFLNFDVWQAASGIVITILLALMLRYSALGRRIKATRGQPRPRPDDRHRRRCDVRHLLLPRHDLRRVAAIWYALKFTVDPAMGSAPIIYAFVVAFLAGTARSPIRVFVTGIVVALIEQYSSIWLSVRWTQTAVFVVLVGYLTVLAVRSSAFTARFRRPLTRT